MTEFTLADWKINLRVSPRKLHPVLTTRQDHSGRLCTFTEAANQTVCDGVIIKRTDPPAAITTADCLPLVLTTAECAFALHISRKTLLTPLVSQTIEQVANQTMTGIFMGPHLCPRHLVFEYEGEEIVAFKKRFPLACKKLPNGTSLSLKIACEELLQPLITPATPLVIDNRCTYEDKTLPSYRRWLEGGKHGELQHLFTTVSAPR